MQVLLHVGLHKTATTWLQKRIFAAPDGGFVTPWGPQAGQSITEFVAVDPLKFDPLAARRRFEESLAAMADREGKIPTISHEGLSSRPNLGQFYAPLAAERMKAAFPDAKLFLMFREQKALLNSLYSQHLHRGGRLTLEEFIGTGNEPAGWTPLIFLSFYEYDALIGMYRRVFGEENVLALPLEMMARDQYGFVERLCAFAGAAVPADTSFPPENVAWKPFSTEILRRLNYISRPYQLGPYGGSFAFYRKIARRIEPLIPNALHQKVKARRQQRIEARVGDLYAPSNDRTSEMIGVDLKEYGYPSASAGR